MRDGGITGLEALAGQGQRYFSSIRSHTARLLGVRCKTLGMPNHEEHAGSFDAAAAVYARSRPAYPGASIAWLLEDIDGTVVDLGAGTGLLAQGLVGRAAEVIAVEPSDNMRSELSAALPSVTALKGTGESMPLADGTANAVLCAQAWHWVDVDHASREVARVLRPGGRLGLIWNLRDESTAWVREFGRIMHGRDSAGWSDRIRAGRPEVGEGFGALESHTTSWTQTLDVDGLVDLASSRSYVITMPGDKRREVLAAVRALAMESAVDGTIELPYQTYSFRAPRGEA